METDVTEWLLVVDWDARPETPDQINARLSKASELIRRAIPSLADAWMVRGQLVDASIDQAWAAIIAESVSTVDGHPEPMRGFSLSLIAELDPGAYLHVAVTAGARFQTVVNKPNEFALDFRAGRFGDRLTVDLGAAAEETFRDLGHVLQFVWGATELRVSFAYEEDPRTV